MRKIKQINKTLKNKYLPRQVNTFKKLNNNLQEKFYNQFKTKEL